MIESIWGLRIPRKRTCEHPRRLDSAAYILTDEESSLYLERAALHLNLHPYRSFWLTYRNHTARRPKSGVYAEVVCRKCRERITEERRSHLGTSSAPVCPLLPQYPNTHAHSLAGGRDICPTSQIRTEVRMKKFWARHREARQVIDLDGLFSDYWSSSDNEFTVLGQSLSPTGPLRSD